jgi:hypothetical protein
MKLPVNNEVATPIQRQLETNSETPVNNEVATPIQRQVETNNETLLMKLLLLFKDK